MFRGVLGDFVQRNEKPKKQNKTQPSQACSRSADLGWCCDERRGRELEPFALKMDTREKDRGEECPGWQSDGGE
jgi:hypothetical protein